MNKKSGQPIRGLLRLRENPIERLSIMCFSCPLWLDRTINAGPLKSRFRERSLPDRGSAVGRERAPSASPALAKFDAWEVSAVASSRADGPIVRDRGCCRRAQLCTARNTFKPCRIISAPGRNHGAAQCARGLPGGKGDSKIEYRLLAKLVVVRFDAGTRSRHSIQ